MSFLVRNLQIFIFQSPNDVLQSLYLYGFVKGATNDCVFGYMVGAVFQPDFRPFEGGSFLWQKLLGCEWHWRLWRVLEGCVCLSRQTPRFQTEPALR